jgi:hypothetical protein
MSVATQRQYFVVGATWEEGDMLPKFIRGGYWQMGWADVDKPAMAKIRDQIRVGDRIAAKKMVGGASGKILILALGTVRELCDAGIIQVNWVVTDLEREVPGHACFDTIRGPFDLHSADSAWVREVFCL